MPITDDEVVKGMCTAYDNAAHDNKDFIETMSTVLAYARSIIEREARDKALTEAAKIAERHITIHRSTCQYASTGWDTNAFNCSLRGDCLCQEREEEAEAIQLAILALKDAPHD